MQRDQDHPLEYSRRGNIIKYYFREYIALYSYHVVEDISQM